MKTKYRLIGFIFWISAQASNFVFFFMNDGTNFVNKVDIYSSFGFKLMSKGRRADYLRFKKSINFSEISSIIIMLVTPVVTVVVLIVKLV